MDIETPEDNKSNERDQLETLADNFDDEKSSGLNESIDDPLDLEKATKK